MNFSPISHRTSRRGFTLVEMIVSASLIGVVTMMMISALVSTMKLSSQNVVTNISNYRARQTLDRIGQTVRFAQDTPVLIKSDGTAATGNADGLLVKNSLGGPYLFKNSSGQNTDIPSGTTSFMVEFAGGAGVTAPTVGDFFTLALATQPELEVTAVTAASSVGNISRVQITTRQAIAEIAKASSYSVTGYRYRKEAYIFVQSGSYWSLRHYPKVTGVTNYSDAASYRVRGTGFQKLGTQPWFTMTTDSGTQSCWLRAVARSSDHAEYAERSGRNTLSSMPVQIKLWNYNAPPPPAS